MRKEAKSDGFRRKKHTVVRRMQGGAKGTTDSMFLYVQVRLPGMLSLDSSIRDILYVTAILKRNTEIRCDLRFRTITGLVKRQYRSSPEQMSRVGRSENIFYGKEFCGTTSLASFNFIIIKYSYILKHSSQGSRLEPNHLDI